VTYINIAEDGKEASHTLKSRGRSRIKSILELRKSDEEGNADDALFSPFWELPQLREYKSNT
jgi:hypothetical protein